MSNPYLKYSEFEVEKSKRHHLIQPLTGIHYEYEAIGDSNIPSASAEGTISFYIAKKNSADLKAIKQSAENNAPIDNKLFKNLLKQYAKRKVVKMNEAVDTILKSPTIFDVKYNDVVLFGNLMLADDLDVVIISMPYTGGKINPKKFQISTYSKNLTDTPLEGLAIVNSPKLSKAEYAALKKIKPEMVNIHFGDTSPVSWCPAVTAVVYVITVTAICFHRKLAEVHIPDERIKTQLPEFTATELLALRKKILSGEIA
jgi:hypothetical protein